MVLYLFIRSIIHLSYCKRCYIPMFCWNFALYVRFIQFICKHRQEIPNPTGQPERPLKNPRKIPFHLCPHIITVFEGHAMLCHEGHAMLCHERCLFAFTVESSETLRSMSLIWHLTTWFSSLWVAMEHAAIFSKGVPGMVSFAMYWHTYTEYCVVLMSLHECG